MTQGWNYFTDPPQKPASSADEVKKARDFHDLFSTPLGKRCLSHMRERSIEQTIFSANATDGEMMAIYMGYREGENAFYRWIVDLIEKGKTND